MAHFLSIFHKLRERVCFTKLMPKKPGLCEKFWFASAVFRKKPGFWRARAILSSKTINWVFIEEANPQKLQNLQTFGRWLTCRASINYSGSQKSEDSPMPYALCPMPYALCPMPYALCPMPYALCPMPYALCPMPFAYLIFLRKAISTV